jgi:hypothetical protein
MLLWLALILPTIFLEMWFNFGWQHARFKCFSMKADTSMKIHYKVRLTVCGKYSECGVDIDAICIRK